MVLNSSWYEICLLYGTNLCFLERFENLNRPFHFILRDLSDREWKSLIRVAREKVITFQDKFAIIDRTGEFTEQLPLVEVQIGKYDFLSSQIVDLDFSAHSPIEASVISFC